MAKNRSNYVLPVLAEYDRSEFERVADANQAWPYSVFQPSMDGLPLSSLFLDWGHETWSLYRAWACVRVLGRWPLAVFGAGGLPRSLEFCPLCEEHDVGVEHLLTSCKRTTLALHEWAECVGHSLTGQVSWNEFARLLFGGRISYPHDNPAHGEACVLFVGRCCAMAARAICNQALANDVDDMIVRAEAAADAE